MRVDRAAVIGEPRGTVRATLAQVFLVACTLVLPGCMTRYILGRSDLQDAIDHEAFYKLGVYVTHRTLPVYQRDLMSSTDVGRTIRSKEAEDLLDRPIRRNDVGLIVDHDHVNGAHRLWVSFSPSCREIACAYGFVQTEDGRYRLATLPEREDFESVKVYRTWEMDRQELKLGKIRSVSDANPVYRLERKRKKRPKTVFLEVKRKRQKIRRRARDPEGGN